MSVFAPAAVIGVDIRRRILSLICFQVFVNFLNALNTNSGLFYARNSLDLVTNCLKDARAMLAFAALRA